MTHQVEEAENEQDLIKKELALAELKIRELERQKEELLRQQEELQHQQKETSSPNQYETLQHPSIDDQLESTNVEHSQEVAPIDVPHQYDQPQESNAEEEGLEEPSLEAQADLEAARI